MQKTLNTEQLQKLAYEMYSHFGNRHPTRTGLKFAYIDQNLGSEKTFFRKLENEGALLSDVDCYWIINNLLNAIDTIPLNNIFLRAVEDMPENFGFKTGTYKPLPFGDKTTELPKRRRRIKKEVIEP